MGEDDNRAAGKFSREQLKKMLSLLNDELREKDVTGEICIVGGAAMILAFGSRHSTRDIDALMMAPSIIGDLAKRVADAHGLPAEWLNDGVKEFASGRQLEASQILQLSHLRVLTPPAEYILAMKCIAARVGPDEHDKEDAIFLVRHLGLKDAGEVMRVVLRYYDERQIPAKTRYFVQEVMDESLGQAS